MKLKLTTHPESEGCVSLSSKTSSNTATNSVSCCALLTRAAVGPQPLVRGGVGLGTAACPPAGSEASKSALATDSSPEAWHLDSRGISLSPSLATLARLRPNLSSGLARVAVRVDSFPTSQPIRQGSSQLRPARLTASLDGPLKGSQTALVRAATAATGSATIASAATPAVSFRQSWQQ